jgi:hypothetical protein
MMMQMQLMKKDGEAWFKRKRSKKSGSEFGEDHVIKREERIPAQHRLLMYKNRTSL